MFDHPLEPYGAVARRAVIQAYRTEAAGKFRPQARFVSFISGGGRKRMQRLRALPDGGQRAPIALVEKA
jgi:hypothetical protein